MSGAADDAARVRARLLALLNHDLRAPLARIATQAAGSAPDPRAIESAARRQLEWLADLQDCARYELQPPELTPAPAYLHALLRHTAHDDAALQALPALAVLDARLLAHTLRKLHQHAVRMADAMPAAASVRPLALRVTAVPGAVTLRFGTGTCAATHDDNDNNDDNDNDDNDAWRDVAASLAGDAIDPGLMLAAHLVRAMDGRLQQAGDSLRFQITVPLAQEHDAMPPAPRFDPPEPFGDGRTVLLLEPHGPMHDYLLEILESAAFDVLSEAGAGRPALVLCANENVWNEVAHEDGPPVLLHAMLPPQRPQDFACVLYKPAPPEVLLNALRRLLAVSAPGVRR
ncbi:hypothetical protein [Duganella aceris]|uniref:Sensor histidine kinase n=1 Tax=Duganella aceris TaxID=2703883 RepID=A0ABX0FG19_9BURK|nr:hypothetical protein [Duganella aceris]NGZ83499.1 hypothetical protein [Duganella aceris]